MVKIIALILGLIVAAGVAFIITASLVQKSNEFGNSEGTFEDFSKHDITVLKAMDRGKQKDYASMISMNHANGVHTTRWVKIAKNGNDLSGGTLDGEGSD